MSVKTILYLDHTAKLGGGEIALLDLIRALDHSRYRPVVALASDGPLAARLRDAGIDTHVLPLDTAIVETRKDSLGAGSLLRLRQVLSLVRYAIRLARWARASRVDLIHTNSLKADLYGGLAGRLARIPVVWHVRDNIDSQYLPPIVAAAFRTLARIVPREVAANSESTLRTLRLRRGRGAVVYSGVTPRPSGASSTLPGGAGRFAPLPTPRGVETESNIHEDERSFSESPVVALIGRIAAWKGQHVFLRAAARALARFPQTRFWVIGAPLFGEHEYEQSLHELTCDLGIENAVEFLGFRDDVADLLERIDLVVHASTLGEPFGQVVVQGMAAGKPVIATNGGALPEIVIPGETGLLVPMGDHEAMAQAIEELLADPQRAHTMGAAGRRRVQECFTIGHTVRKAQSLYDQILRVSEPNRVVPRR